MKYFLTVIKKTASVDAKLLYIIFFKEKTILLQNFFLLLHFLIKNLIMVK